MSNDKYKRKDVSFKIIQKKKTLHGLNWSDYLFEEHFVDHIS